MFRKTILSALASAALMCGQIPSTIERAVPAIFPPPVQAFEELKQHLGLSDAQLQQLRDILAESDRARQDLYRQMAEKQTELNGLLAGGSRDAARIGQLMIDVHALRNQASAPTGPWRERALAVLTAERRTKLALLDQALKLSTPAHQAISLNLLDAPQPGRPVILSSGASLVGVAVERAPTPAPALLP